MSSGFQNRSQVFVSCGLALLCSNGVDVRLIWRR
jgi:hypothetical protein